jgi:hypothetical protein
MENEKVVPNWDTTSKEENARLLERYKGRAFNGEEVHLTGCPHCGGIIAVYTTASSSPGPEQSSS